MKDRITKLIKIKSIVTLILTAIFAFLCIRGQVSAEMFITIFMMVITSLYKRPSDEKEDSKK